MTEVWFRNPHNYIRELVAEDQRWIAWDRGVLVKKRMNPVQHAKLYFGPNVDFRLLLIGPQGAAELGPENTIENPRAVYPVWNYTDDTAILEEIVEDPVGWDENLCVPGKYAPDETPVFAQEHRVIVTGVPPGHSGAGRSFLSFLSELQEDYPDCVIHYHGTYSYRTAFGLGFKAADIDPRLLASKGRVTLPNGRNIFRETAGDHTKWITLVGYKPVDLKEPSKRCRYNIRSAVWASQHYADSNKLPSVKTDPAPDETEANIVYRRKAFPIAPKQPGDKFACNTCSVQLTCDYYRLGAVCAVPGSEPVSLGKFFHTRDSGKILDGLGTLMKINTDRLNRGLTEEAVEGINPEVTKIIKQLFDNGVTLAKLVDPALRDPKLAITTGPGSTVAIINGSPNQAVSAVIHALEAKGIKREDITPTMVEHVLESMALQEGDKNKAIEGTVISTRDEI